MPIALIGRVYCKVDANHSSIEIGDLLTTSHTRGQAMKAEDPHKAFGAVLGKTRNRDDSCARGATIGTLMVEKPFHKNEEFDKTRRRVSSLAGAADTVNVCCHNLTPMLPANAKHLLWSPHIVPVMWGHYYAANAGSAVVTALVNLITDLVTGAIYERPSSVRRKAWGCSQSAVN
jgi:hypothetical protein